MDNYYERLEVSKNASKEIIEKAYKVLAKRYHPDMHEEAKKEWAESEFKKINEAYEILSDDIKRKEYDETIEQEENEKYKELVQEIELLKQRLLYYEKEDKQNETIEVDAASSQENDINQEEEPEQEYDSNDNYQYNHYSNNNWNSNNTYSYTKKESLLARIGKNILTILLTIIVIAIIAFVLWQMPVTRKWLLEIYQENPGIKGIIDSIIS